MHASTTYEHFIWSIQYPQQPPARCNAKVISCFCCCKNGRERTLRRIILVPSTKTTTFTSYALCVSSHHWRDLSRNKLKGVAFFGQHSDVSPFQESQALDRYCGQWYCIKVIQLKLSKFHNRLAIVSVLIYNISSQVHVLRPDFSGSSYQNHGAFLSVPQLFRMVFFIHDVFFCVANISFFIFENLPKLSNFHFNSFKQTFVTSLSLLKDNANTNRNQPKRVGSSLFHQ